MSGVGANDVRQGRPPRSGIAMLRLSFATTLAGLALAGAAHAATYTVDTTSDALLSLAVIVPLKVASTATGFACSTRMSTCRS